MTAPDDTYECETCDTVVPIEDVIRTETMGGLDPNKWQTFCCPECGSRLQTVFVGSEEG